MMHRLLPALLAFVLAAIICSPAMAEAPDKLNVAFILTVGPDEPWDRTFIQGWKRIKEEAPHGLQINDPPHTVAWGADAEKAIRTYARTGKFDIIWAHSSYSDQIKKIKDKYPDIMFVVSGSGNEGLGGNLYWAYQRSHEASYLLGVMAGHLTKTNTIGLVGTFPADDVNDVVNAYFMGAKTVNPEIKTKTGFIESWWDPPKARETANAQIAAGADVIFQVATAFEACQDKKILCFGAYTDWHEAAPDVVVASMTIAWEPHIRWIVEEWYQRKSAGEPFAGNSEKKWFSMAEGAGDIVISPVMKDKIPAEVIAEVEKTKQQILSGALQVPVIVDLP